MGSKATCFVLYVSKNGRTLFSRLLKCKYGYGGIGLVRWIMVSIRSDLELSVSPARETYIIV